MKNAFEDSQKTIEGKNIEESIKYFEFKISSISNIKDIVEEFMNLCNKFINTFK